MFKLATGVTPKAYAEQHRARRVRAALQTDATRVTDAIYEAGFSSGSRFYEKSDGLLGMRPGDYRSGGAGTEIRFAAGESSLGTVLVAQSARGICAILIGASREEIVRELEARFPRARLIAGDRAFERTVARVVELIETPARGLDLPLDVQGTAFQQRVWQALSSIPAGSTATYTEIAQRLGMPNGARAVAGACAANRIGVAIPCHRAVGSDGSLTGYRWGIERKRRLLAREKGPASGRPED